MLLVADQKPWIRGFPLIAHALGEIEGRTYTNSADALRRSYELGFRMFEADIALTSDGVPVLIHGWTRKDYERLGWKFEHDDFIRPMSVTEFRSARIHGKYSTMLLSDLFEFMESHPDVRILFDIRPQTPQDTAEIYELVRRQCANDMVWDRCMAGTYNPEMAAEVAAQGYFEAINLFYDASLYADLDEFVMACQKYKIQTVTIDIHTMHAASEQLLDAGIDPIVFTANQPSDCLEALELGVKAVGTDRVTPESVKRKRQTWVHELSAYSDQWGNVIVYHGEKPPPSVGVRIRGSNNLLVVSSQARLKKLEVIFDNDNARVTIGSTRSGIPAASLKIRAGQDSSVTIGNDFSSTGPAFISATEGTTVSVGDDVMFARGNEVRADDAHAIYDVHSGKRVNVSESIDIGDHVWLARDAVLLSGASVGSGTVIGYRSLVTGAIPNNCIAVGSPARVTRRDIAWERNHLDDYQPYKEDASVVRKSEYWHTTS